MAKLIYAITADSASLDESTKKVSIIGVFENMSAPSYPAVQKDMTIVVRLELPEKSKTYKEYFTILGPDNKEVSRNSPVEFVPKSIHHNFLHRIINLSLPEKGRYTINIYVDDEIVGSGYFDAELLIYNTINVA